MLEGHCQEFFDYPLKKKEIKMSPADVLDISREAIYMFLTVASPLMLIALVVGLVVSLFQALTQIQEMTLTFVPKIIALFLSLIFLLPFIGSTMGTFSENLFNYIKKV